MSIELGPHDLTSPTSHPPFSMSVSGNYYSGAEPYAAFDGSYSAGAIWLTLPCWIMIDCGFPGHVLEGYKLATYDQPDRAPKSWIVEGSITGAHWVTLDIQTGVTGWTDGAPGERTFGCSEGITSPFRFFRLRISACGSGSITTIGEWSLLGSILPSIVVAPSYAIKDLPVTVTVKCQGTAFDGSTVVTISGADVTVGAVDLISDHELTVEVTSASLSYGSRVLVATTGGVGYAYPFQVIPVGFFSHAFSLRDGFPTDGSEVSSSGFHGFSPDYAAFNKLVEDFGYIGPQWRTDGDFATVNPAWLAVKCPAAHTLVSYIIQISPLVSTEMAPTEWTIEGSNDGVTWDVLDTRTGVVEWSIGEIKEFYLSDLALPYYRFRISITANNGDANNVSIEELYLLGPDSQFILIDPDHGPQASVVDVLVVGGSTHFDSTTRVTVGGLGVTAAVPTDVSATAFRVLLTIDGDAPPTSRVFTVTTGDEVLIAEFTVTTEGGQRGNIDYDQIRRIARTGNGPKLLTWSYPVPPTLASAGTPGEVSFDPDTGELYLCYAPDLWKKFIPA